MKKYRVFIERTENYFHQVVVSARSAEEAERKVRRMDDNDKFVNEWNELRGKGRKRRELRMKVGILVKIDRDELGNFTAPEVTAYPTPAEAQDAMLADFNKTKAERFSEEDSVSDDMCDSDEAYIAGTDDTYVSWWAFEREV